jgi:hypothetical protein
MAKVLCVLYDDPVDGMPKTYARDGIPHIAGHPGGPTPPTPQQIDPRIKEHTAQWRPFPRSTVAQHG